MNSFLLELRRRNVHRVAAAYAAVAWLIAQIIEMLIGAYALDPSLLGVAVTILAVGFVPAVALAWIFQWTPQGLQIDDADAGAPVSSPAATRRIDRAIIIILAVAVAVLAVDKFMLRPPASPDGTIAVLPFENLSADPEQEYFSSGIANEVRGLLTQVPTLRVSSRDSIATLVNQGKSITEIADVLNVIHVLDGSVQRAGERLRITVNLTDMRSDRQVWSRNWDRPLEDVFAIQDEVANDVVAMMRRTVDASKLPRARTTSPEVLDLYLRARHLQLGSGRSNESDTALGLLEQAYALDPTYLPVVLELGATLYSAVMRGAYPVESGNQRIPALMAQAAAIDDQDPGYLAYAGYGQFVVQRNLEAATGLIEQAVAAAPSDVSVLLLAGQFASEIRQFETALTMHQRALDLDPLCATCLYHVLRTHIYSEDYDEALAAFERYEQVGSGGAQTLGTIYLMRGEAEKAIEAFSGPRANDFQVDAGVAMALHDLGRTDEAEAALERARQKLPRSALDLARAYAWTGRTDQAFEILDRIIAERPPIFASVARDPSWRNLHDDPRWIAYREQAGIGQSRLEAIEFNPKLPE